MTTQYLFPHWLPAILLYAKEATGIEPYTWASPQWKGFLAGMRPWFGQKHWARIRESLRYVDTVQVTGFILFLQQTETDGPLDPRASIELVRRMLAKAP